MTQEALVTISNHEIVSIFSYMTQNMSQQQETNKVLLREMEKL